MPTTQLNISGERQVTTDVYFPEARKRVRTTVYYFMKKGAIGSRGIASIEGTTYNVKYTGIWRVI